MSPAHSISSFIALYFVVLSGVWKKASHSLSSTTETSASCRGKGDGRNSVGEGLSCKRPLREEASSLSRTGVGGQDEAVTLGHSGREGLMTGMWRPVEVAFKSKQAAGLWKTGTS